MSEAIHRTVWDSISVAAGDNVQAPTFGFTAAARNSPRIPIGAGGAVIYPKKRGWAFKEGMIEQQLGLFQQQPRIHSRFRERTCEVELRVPPTGIHRGSQDQAAMIRGTLRPGLQVDAPASETSRRPLLAARADRNHQLQLSLLLQICESYANSFQKIRLPRPSAAHGAKRPIEGLVAPQGLVIV